ncbi:predicted protein [Naegleria gruberi]|uniref:Predicted protein n=1 Tax=Naegleria gruberi TaxID=5762 RepID=D2VVS2_NAEGR|nr:uncharacterized protein NAEGRDRAFT_73122 [Naegleria gruberi]EFC39088.1 predicted protein [Naegleria gruberi]|eukprot:XP_002671832.1 predicted protein [Naegleria gruberi strain NEG-M]
MAQHNSSSSPITASNNDHQQRILSNNNNNKEKEELGEDEISIPIMATNNDQLNNKNVENVIINNNEEEEDDPISNIEENVEEKGLLQETSTEQSTTGLTRGNILLILQYIRRVTSVAFVNRSEEEGMSGVSAVPNNKEIYSHLFNWNSFKSLAPFGVLTGFDYACSTLGLKFITISLYTMLKSSVPVFVMIISFICKMEKVKFILIISIVLISIGVGMTSKGTIHFDIIGFVLVMVAVVFTALRLVIAQYVLQRSNTQIIYTRLSSAESLDSPTIGNPSTPTAQPSTAAASIETGQTFEYFYARDSGEQFRASKVEISSVQIFFYTAPVIALTVLPIALILELNSIISVFSNLQQAVDATHSIHMLRFLFILKFVAMVFVGSMLGIILNVSEFLLIKQTSSLTLTVLSIFKELLMIAIAVMIFGDHIGVLGYIGYGLCLIGLIIYKVHRFLDSKSSH